MDMLSGLQPARVLVATRDPDELSRLAAFLEQAGCEVERACDAADAARALERGPFDAALTDAGLHALAFPRDRRVPWIALIDAGDSPQPWLEQGARAVIRRPLRADDLLRELAGALRDRAALPPADTAAPVTDERPTLASQFLERRLAEQQTLSRLARSLSAVLELDILLTQVVDAAVRLCSAEEGLLLLPDEDGQTLYIRAAKGLDSRTARNFRIKTQDTLAGQVFRSGQPLLIGSHGMHKIKTEYFVRSLLYVPLAIKGQTIGVLGVNNRQADRAFSQHDQELLQDLAAHAAVAIENARLYEESVLRTRELSTLVQAGEAANSTLAIDQVLSIIAAQLVGALDAAQCYIAEWQPTDSAAFMLASCYRALWQPTAGPTLSLDDYPSVEQAFRQKRAVVTSAAGLAEGDAAAWLPHHSQAQSVATVPLLAGDQPLGVVILYRMHAPFPEPAIPQAAYLDFHQLALDMVGTMAGADAREQRQALFRIARRMLTALKADWCEVALWNTAHRRFNVTLSYGEYIWREDAKARLDLAHYPQLARILTEQAILNGAPAADLRPLADLGHGKSVLGVPLEIKGETAGLVLLVDTLRDRHFAPREVKLVQALVMQAANALDNARLYRDLQLSLIELHQTQARLVQTARLSAMGELAAAVAHQINNPLTTILGDTELILRDLPPDDPNVEALEAISRAGRRAHEVVRRLLGMARQPSAEVPPEPVSVNDTIRNTLALVEGHIRQGRIALAVDLEEGIPPVTGMPGQLEDVWLNLLLNARDAVAERADPQIGIATRQDVQRGQVQVVVWDNGCGMDEALQRQIFEPFFTTKPPGEGTGLGLHIARQIVEKCHGDIRVESAYNQGARFIISLPVYPGRGAA